MDESAKFDTVCDYLRLTYAASGSKPADIPGLRKKLADLAANGALESVTITGDSFEGKSHHGQLTFEPLLYLKAAMAILREIDPTNVPDVPVRGALTDFRYQIIGT